MNPDELEFAISQYHDGTLAPEQRAVIEDRLRTDPAARAILAEFEKLDSLVRTGCKPLPNFDWDRLAEHISERIEEEMNPAPISMSAWFARTGGMAIAASVLVMLGTFLYVRQPNATPNTSEESIAIVAPQTSDDEQVEVALAAPPDAAEYETQSNAVHQSKVTLEGFTPAAIRHPVEQ